MEEALDGSHPLPAEKRTNSLAFAQIDCHTCATLGDKCDRRRPKCSRCLGKGRRCGGFATALSWDSKRMFSCNPTSNLHERSGNSSAQELDICDSSTNQIPGSVLRSPDPPARFRFVEDRARRKRRRKTTQTGKRKALNSQQNSPKEHFEVSTCINPNMESENLDMASPTQARDGLDVPTLDPFNSLPLIGTDIADSIIPSVFDSTFWLDFETPESLRTKSTDLLLMPNTPMPATDMASGIITEEEFQDCHEDHGSNNEAPHLTQEEGLDIGRMNLPCTIPANPTNTTILDFSFQDHGWLFEMYDSELCVLPLTSDIAINPFRCKIPAQQGSRILYHAVLALCYRHLNRLTCNWTHEVTEHHGKAVQLLEEELKSRQTRGNLQLLEPILILFTLDCTLSATGRWAAHLERAYTLLQACGGPPCLTSQRARSQVGMLLWWDATLALISRRCPVLDRSYLDFLVRWEKQDDWSFFDLTGCPRDLVIILYNLVELAQQSEIASSMKWLTFDLSPVLDTEENLKKWKNDFDPLLQINKPDSTAPQAEDNLHGLEDRYHCAEAWRHALLLYIQSVFKRGSAECPFSIAFLGRKTLDHIRCCRRSSQTQKQLLLPIFLAGSKTTDPGMRQFVQDFCQYWSEKSRYSMFNSAITILQEIWTTGMWWGAVIDGKTALKSSPMEDSPTQVLLG